MANPFYIRKRRSPVLDIASLALQYQALKDRGALTKRGQDIQEKGQALKKEQFKKEWGEDVVTPTSRMVPGGHVRHIKGSIERGEDIDKSRIAINERVISLAERKEDARIINQEKRFDKEQGGPADRQRLLNRIKEHPELSPWLNVIKWKLNNDEYKTKDNVYHHWKGLESSGELPKMGEALIKAGDAMLLKGETEPGNRKIWLGKTISAPNFVDNLYNVPESRRATVKTPQVTWGERETAKGLGEIQTSSTGKVNLIKAEKTDKPTDFETAYKQHIGIPGNEKRTRLQFKKLWTPVKEKTEKLSDLKTIGEIEVAFMEYNDQEILGAYGSMYNRKNKQGKIAYWNENKENKGWFKGVGGIEIIKLPRDLIKQGWKPSTVQDTAELMNMSVEEFLTELEKDTKLKIINK